MRQFDRSLGGQDVLIFAPEPGSFDHDAFRAVFPAGGLYGLDVEGTMLTDLGHFDPDFAVRLVQFGTVGYAWVLDVADPDQRAAAVGLLSDPDVRFCSHSPMDVLAVWVAFGVDIVDRNVDTLVLANMAHTDRLGDRDLKALTAEHIGPELGQAETELHELFRSMWLAAGGKANAKASDVDRLGWATVSTSSPEYLVYAGLDAVACRRLAEVLVPLTGAPERLLEVEMWLAAQANRIQIRGLLVDAVALDELSAEVNGHSTRAEARISELTGLKARSPKLIEWFGRHGAEWDRWEKLGGALTNKGKPSLAKENVKLLRQFALGDRAREAAEALIEFRDYQDRVLKTDAVRQYLAPDGRVHATLKTTGATQTARMSSSNPNIQNFSKKDPRTRGLFIPSPGRVLISSDFDQVELRVVAALAGERKMIDAIHRGDDLHQLTADAIGKPRPIGKMTNFLIVYGGGGKALSEQAGIPRDEADEAVRRFREAYTAINDLASDMGRFKEEIRTVSGRRLQVGIAPNGTPRSYANINYLVQSSARDLLVEAWYRFAVEFGRAEMVWFPIHDELVLEVPEELVDTVMAEVEECMSFDFLGVPISASASVLRDESGRSRWGK